MPINTGDRGKNLPEEQTQVFQLLKLLHPWLLLPMLVDQHWGEKGRVELLLSIRWCCRYFWKE